MKTQKQNNLKQNNLKQTNSKGKNMKKVEITTENGERKIFINGQEAEYHEAITVKVPMHQIENLKVKELSQFEEVWTWPIEKDINNDDYGYFGNFSEIRIGLKVVDENAAELCVTVFESNDIEELGLSDNYHIELAELVKSNQYLTLSEEVVGDYTDEELEEIKEHNEKQKENQGVKFFISTVSNVQFFACFEGKTYKEIFIQLNNLLEHLDSETKNRLKEKLSIKE